MHHDRAQLLAEDLSAAAFETFDCEPDISTADAGAIAGAVRLAVLRTLVELEHFTAEDCGLVDRFEAEETRARLLQLSAESSAAADDEDAARAGTLARIAAGLEL